MTFFVFIIAIFPFLLQLALNMVHPTSRLRKKGIGLVIFVKMGTQIHFWGYLNNGKSLKIYMQES